MTTETKENKPKVEKPEKPKKSSAGKGDSRRPLSVPYDEWCKRWELAFGHKGKLGKRTNKQA